MDAIDALQALIDGEGARVVAADAVRLRRWDERAKEPSADVPGLAWYHGMQYHGMLRRLAQ